jgi:hypothetical protein
MLEPKIKSFRFWSDTDPEEEFVTGVSEFFCIPFPSDEETISEGVASLGFWDGEELSWLMEYYHASGNDLVFYALEETGDVDEVSKEVWFQFVSAKNPECLPWILFRLKDLKLL